MSRYGGHLVQPTAEFAKRKTEVFQLERADIEKIPLLFICGRGGKTKFHPTRRFDPGIYEVEPFVHRLTPTSLDHAKQLAGIPNEVFANARTPFNCCAGSLLRTAPAPVHDLPPGETIHLNLLSAKERTAVHGVSFQLLMGPTDPGLVERAPYKAVVDYMLGRMVQVATFVGKDLIVCPDETVEFSGFVAVYFDNVIVVGNGRIVLGDKTKLHAYQIKHV